MPRRKEVAHSPLQDISAHDYYNSPLEEVGATGYQLHDNEWAALMSTAPHGEPGTIKEDLLPLRDVIADAIDSLPQRERWVFERVVIERRSLAQVAKAMSLSKSHVHRIQQAALETLRLKLEGEELVVAHLKH